MAPPRYSPFKGRFGTTSGQARASKDKTHRPERLGRAKDPSDHRTIGAKDKERGLSCPAGVAPWEREGATAVAGRRDGGTDAGVGAGAGVGEWLR